MILKDKVICGVQQVGIGVRNAEEAWAWYADVLGFNTKMHEEEGISERMFPYTGEKPQSMYAAMAMNPKGGGGLEILEPRERELNYPHLAPKLGDYGVFACKIRATDIKAAYQEMKDKEVKILTDVVMNPAGEEHFFIQDPWNNIFDIEFAPYVSAKGKKNIGGVNGAIIGVSDMDRSVEFYSSVLDYDQIEYDLTESYADFSGVPGGHYKLRRVMLSRSKPLEGPFCELMGPSHIELVERIAKIGAHKSHKIYEGRMWGDPGFIHLCFDVRNMEEVRNDAARYGHDFVCDSGKDSSIGDISGHFTCMEDPDGTLIRFVETSRMPLIKKLGIQLNLNKADDKKPLPGWKLKLLKFRKNR